MSIPLTRDLVEVFTVDIRERITLKNFLYMALALVLLLWPIPLWLHWLAANANTITAGATTALALLTLGYVVLTFLLVQTTYRSYRSQNDPKIVIYIGSPEDYGMEYLFLVIHNAGPSVAYDIQFKATVPTEHPIASRLKLPTIPELDAGLSTMYPGQKVVLILSSDHFRQLQPILHEHGSYKFTIDARWNREYAPSNAKPDAEETFHLTLSEFGIRKEQAEGSPLLRIASAIEDVNHTRMLDDMIARVGARTTWGPDRAPGPKTAEPRPQAADVTAPPPQSPTTPRRRPRKRLVITSGSIRRRIRALIPALRRRA